jgi:hypothetical protein
MYKDTSQVTTKQRREHIILLSIFLVPMLSHIRHLLIDQLRQQKEQGKSQVTLQFHTKALSCFLSKKNTFLS